jgi:hypothetical protein
MCHGEKYFELRRRNWNNLLCPKIQEIDRYLCPCQWAGAVSATAERTRAPMVPGALPAQVEARYSHESPIRPGEQGVIQKDRGL